jgi:hypothetical protein
MDATKTKAGGGGQPAFHSYARPNRTAPSRSEQAGNTTAARYAGTVLREARNIVEQINKRGPGPGIKLASQRLREALDSLDWLGDYVEHEVRP